MKYSILGLAILCSCSSTGSVVLDKDGNIVDDTAVVDTEDTGDTEEPDDTDIEETEDTQNTEDTEDTENTDDTQDTEDTEEPVEIPEDNNNPNIDDNSWEGTRVLSYDGCSETINESGPEVTADYPNWMSICNCDEIYYITVDRQTACGLPLRDWFYRAVKYNGLEMDVLDYPVRTDEPYEPSLLAIATINEDGETWSFSYDVEQPNGTANLAGLVNFLP